MNDDIVGFIERFKKYDTSNVLETTFLNGYCYYFSIILQERFGGEILYDPVEGHFLLLYKNNLYDIRGNVSHLYELPNLSTKQDWLLQGSVVRGVILKYDY